MSKQTLRRDGIRWALVLLAVGASVAAVFAGRTQASGAPGATPVTAGDTVVLTGSYSCTILSYTILQPPSPTPEPISGPGPEPEAQDPVVVRELSHAISISGTGGLTTVGPPTPGPGIGGVSGRRGFTTAPVNLGSGVGFGFDGGTLEDCVRFADAVAAVANGLGCVTSPVRSRTGVPIQTAEARFSFVCEGPGSAQIHAIGELDRAVLAQRPASAP